MGHNMTGPLPDRYIDGDNYGASLYTVCVYEKKADGRWCPEEVLAKGVSSDEAERIAKAASDRLGLPYTVDN